MVKTNKDHQNYIVDLPEIPNVGTSGLELVFTTSPQGATSRALARRTLNNRPQIALAMHNLDGRGGAGANAHAVDEHIVDEGTGTRLRGDELLKYQELSMAETIADISERLERYRNFLSKSVQLLAELTIDCLTSAPMGQIRLIA